jgi:hypothetical protein
VLRRPNGIERIAVRLPERASVQCVQMAALLDRLARFSYHDLGVDDEG